MVFGEKACKDVLSALYPSKHLGSESGLNSIKDGESMIKASSLVFRKCLMDLPEDTKEFDLEINIIPK